jgi:8-oxo-dGTP diphosphatase
MERRRLVGKRFPLQAGIAMTTTVDRTALTRHVHFHDPHAPAATVVVPSVFVAVRSWDGRLLLVRRIDSGCWELPAGRVDVGESAEAAAVRETLEEAGVKVVVTGLIGLFTDPGHVVRAADGGVRQQFAVLFRARAVGGEHRVRTRPTAPPSLTAPRWLSPWPSRWSRTVSCWCDGCRGTADRPLRPDGAATGRPRAGGRVPPR